MPQRRAAKSFSLSLHKGGRWSETKVEIRKYCKLHQSSMKAIKDAKWNFSLFIFLESAPKAWRDKRTICVWFWAEFYAPIDSLSVRLIKTAKIAVMNTFYGQFGAVAVRFFRSIESKKRIKKLNQCAAQFCCGRLNKNMLCLFFAVVCAKLTGYLHTFYRAYYLFIYENILHETAIKCFLFTFFPSYVLMFFHSLTSRIQQSDAIFFFEERTKNSPTQTEIQVLKTKIEWLSTTK